MEPVPAHLASLSLRQHGGSSSGRAPWIESEGRRKLWRTLNQRADLDPLALLPFPFFPSSLPRSRHPFFSCDLRSFHTSSDPRWTRFRSLHVLVDLIGSVFPKRRSSPPSSLLPPSLPRQDPRSHKPNRPHHRISRDPTQRDLRRYLHQQICNRDESSTHSQHRS